MEYTEMLEKQVGQLRKANETDYAAYMHALSERNALKAQVKQLREALQLIYPMALGYARNNPVGNNMAFCVKANAALAATEPERKQP